MQSNVIQHSVALKKPNSFLNEHAYSGCDEFFLLNGYHPIFKLWAFTGIPILDNLFSLLSFSMP